MGWIIKTVALGVDGLNHFEQLVAGSAIDTLYSDPVPDVLAVAALLCRLGVPWSGFNLTKGYEFIQPSGGGSKDVFVRISAVERTSLNSLNDGQAVE